MISESSYLAVDSTETPPKASCLLKAYPKDVIKKGLSKLSAMRVGLILYSLFSALEISQTCGEKVSSAKK